MSDSLRMPTWMRRPVPAPARAPRVNEVIRRLRLTTVCGSARCPNRAECFARGTATFMILGDRCARGCRFCAVAAGEPAPPREDEPQAVAQAAAELGLSHVVVTSVTRDDLPDGGAAHFAATIQAVRRRCPDAAIEVLVPDFQGSRSALRRVSEARPDVLNHNVETVPRLYPLARPRGDYARSLDLLAWAKAVAPAGEGPVTKSGLMVGLGESDGEVEDVFGDLRAAGCDILTIGQYLRPTADQLPVARFVRPETFAGWRRQGRRMGFRAVLAGPYVRSSYHAGDVFGGRRLAPRG
ncbi:MAG TPA: lipoyl synthase [Phycisphaerae bacterium]|nr:lipoyl synthase [Phycisphaerae bacterium]